VYLWRAVYDLGDVLAVMDLRDQNTQAAMKLIKRRSYDKPVGLQTGAAEGFRRLCPDRRSR
jgi:hypothetical protein